ncbi:MAG: tRNA glutamyl-Q(34) synthetase GluQRS [Phycisphaerales bacterium]|nr:tRNA glutamyl-Q(34) synthetase GluQRS [Phycisphaerales bacterium]
MESRPGAAAKGVTRLAPSPTGALHLGNARTFLVNWALARRNGWRIVLRIEDLDGPRVKPGAIEGTLRILEWLGIDWDDGPLIQSRDLGPYREAMEALARAGVVYPSELTRAQIEALAGVNEEGMAAEAASAPQEGTREIVFPPSLRPEIGPRGFDREDVNWRLVVGPGEVSFEDRFAGPQRFDVSRTIGDYLVWTKRGQPSYQLAVVVDDARAGVTEVVRGDDLLESAARQLLIYRALGVGPVPSYWHLPLVRGEDGRRLAKRHGDTRLDRYRELGVRAERVIGLAGWWSGIIQDRAEMSPGEFLRRFNISTMPGSAVVFTGEDEAWLLNGR